VLAKGGGCASRSRVLMRKQNELEEKAGDGVRKGWQNEARKREENVSDCR
jgi:hypothetical protein